MARSRRPTGMDLCAPTASQARQVGRVEPIDRASDLWCTSMHEMSHYEAGIAYEWEVAWPVIVGEKQASVHVDIPRKWARWAFLPREGILQDAVISMVGPLMSEQLEYNPDGCEPDRQAVLRIIHPSDISLTEVKTEARRVIRLRHGRIERAAERLYRQYVAKFAVKEYAS